MPKRRRKNIIEVRKFDVLFLADQYFHVGTMHAKMNWEIGMFFHHQAVGVGLLL